jgi:hypothetical protein
LNLMIWFSVFPPANNPVTPSTSCSRSSSCC